MKIESLLKSAMVIGLLAAVTNAHAAEAIKEKNIGRKITLVNESKNDGSQGGWYLQVMYRKCNSPWPQMCLECDDSPSVTLVAPGQKGEIYTCESTNMLIDKLTAPGSTPHRLEEFLLNEQNSKIICDGTYDKANCIIE